MTKKFISVFLCLMIVSVLGASVCAFPEGTVTNEHYIEELAISVTVPENYVTILRNPSESAINNLTQKGVKVRDIVDEMREMSLYLMALDYASISQFTLYGDVYPYGNVDFENEGSLGKFRSHIEEINSAPGRECREFEVVTVNGRQYLRYTIYYNNITAMCRFSTIHNGMHISLGRMNEYYSDLGDMVEGIVFHDAPVFTPSDFKEYTLNKECVKIPSELYPESVSENSLCFLSYDRTDKVSVYHLDNIEHRIDYDNAEKNTYIDREAYISPMVEINGSYNCNVNIISKVSDSDYLVRISSDSPVTSKRLAGVICDNFTLENISVSDETNSVPSENSAAKSDVNILLLVVIALGVTVLFALAKAISICTTSNSGSQSSVFTKVFWKKQATIAVVEEDDPQSTGEDNTLLNLPDLNDVK